VFVKNPIGVEPLNVTVLLPRFIVRTLLLVEVKTEAVTLKLLVVKVPWVSVISPDDVKASPNVTVIPAPLIVNGPIVFPAVVSVAVAFNVSVPLYVTVIPATSVTLPETVIAAEPAKVPVNPVQLIDLAPVLPAEIVQVPLDAASKNTSSADVGTA
jgi:hypothetical protein